MQLKNGFNITQSDMRPLLEQYDKQRSGVRTWRQLFGNAALGYNAQSDALKTDYADAISQAYMSNYAQRNAIASAGLSAGSTQQLLAQNRNDLHTAYEQYVRNYGSDAAKVASAYGEEVNAIEGALTERAQNFANLYNSAYKYLSEELYGSSRTTDEGILDYLKEHNLDWAYLKDEQGNPTDQLMPWSQVAQRLFNTDGTLTIEGQEFFDQMFNSAFDPGYTRYDDRDNEYATRNFRQWLSDTDNELYNWMISQDNFNYNFAGTNFGTAKALLGMESTDSDYHTSEYLTDEKVDKFNKTHSDTSHLSNLPNKIENDNTFVFGFGKTNAYKEAVEADEAVAEASDPSNQYDENAARNRQEAYRGKLQDQLKTETMKMLDTMEKRVSTYEKELNVLLGDRYTDFTNSSAYGNLRRNVEVAAGDLARFLIEMNAASYKYKTTDDYMAEYERYLAEYKKAYDEYFNYLSKYAEATPRKKSSGF